MVAFEWARVMKGSWIHFALVHLCIAVGKRLLDIGVALKKLTEGADAMMLNIL